MTDTFLKIAKFVCAGVCHGLPERCPHIAGIPLNLCARCTGTYLGFFLSSLLLLFRKRIGKTSLPDIKYILIFVLFPLSMPIQYILARTGIIPDYPHLRTSTGVLAGIFLAHIIYPCLNMAFFGVKKDRKILKSPFEFFYVIPVIMAVYTILLFNSTLNYYAVSTILCVSTLAVFTLAGEFVVLIVMEKMKLFKYPLKEKTIIITSFIISFVLALVFISVLSYINTRVLQSLVT